jgi:hypothetical protein
MFSCTLQVIDNINCLPSSHIPQFLNDTLQRWQGRIICSPPLRYFRITSGCSFGQDCHQINLEFGIRQDNGSDITLMYERHGQEIVEILRRKLTVQEGEGWDLRLPFTVDIAGRTIHVTIDRVEASQDTQSPTRFVRTRMKGTRQDDGLVIAFAALVLYYQYVSASSHLIAAR